jgi:hypothetical protein
MKLLNNHNPRSPWRLPLAAVATLAVLAAPAVSQDSDEDGVLPKHGGAGGSQDSSASDTVLLPEAQLGLDWLSDVQARLTITALGGATILDTTDSADEALFVPEGPIDYTSDGESVGLQADGQLLLLDGMKILIEAAPDALARTALLVVTPAGTDQHALLAGQVAPLFVINVGDVPAVDLAQLQHVVDHHSSLLSGLQVSLVFVSVDDQGALHKAAAGFVPGGAAIGIALD